MKPRLKWVRALGCLLVLACSMALERLAQDGASDTVKRKLKTKVVPEYPAVARQLSLQGKVKIDITVSVDGHVTETKVIGGYPLLANAAVNAIRKWRYEPGPKDTTEMIEIDFRGRN